MISRTVHLRLFMLLLLGLWLPSDALAEGRVKRGVRAPPFEATTLPGADGFSLKAARGRFVFLEFFSVDCKHCQRLVPRMNQIHRRYTPQGLLVVAATRERTGQVRAFQRKYGVRYPLVSTHLDVQVEYGVSAYPTAFLLAPNGRVLWRGNPDRMQDRVFDAYLKKFKSLPTRTERFRWVSEAVRDGHFGEVLLRLERHRQCLTIRAEECRFVLAALAWIEGYGRSAMIAAERDQEAGRVYDAWWTYEHLVSGYADTPTAETARQHRDALLSDPGRRREIEAHAALVSARSSARRLGPNDGAVALKAVVLRHSGTRAARTAQALAAGWVRRGD